MKVRPATKDDFKIGTTLIDCYDNKFTLRRKYDDGVWECNNRVHFLSEYKHYKVIDMRLLDSSTDFQELVEETFIVPNDKALVMVGSDGIPYELYGKSKVVLSRKFGTLSDSFHIHSGSANQ